MGALRNPGTGFDISPENTANNLATLAAGRADHQEATMATVMMARYDDTSVQMRFHRLLLMDAGDKVLSSHPLNRRITYVGRSRRNQVKVEDPLVSTRHLTVSVSDSTCTVNDLDSTNGTFINGERLAGSRVLNHGDEILMGKTVLRFAARQVNTPDLPRHQPPQRPAAPIRKRQGFLLAAAVLILVLSVGLVYEGLRRAGVLYAKGGSWTEAAGDPSPPASEERTTPSQPATEFATGNDLSQTEAQAGQNFHIQRALAAYTEGQLDNAIQILSRLTLARENTPEAFQAKNLLSMIGTVRELHAEALQAQAQKKFAKAVESWDRLLTADMELVGDRPSYFAAQAEQRIQTLSYEYALDAYRTKNYAKARQLCHVVLQINPDHSGAAAMLAKIDPKA